MTLMGVRGVRQRVTAHLESLYPDALEQWRVEHGLDSKILRDPVAYYPHEPQALDRWPMVAVTTPRMAGLQRSELIDGDTTEYVSSYAVRVFVWTNAGGWAQAIAERDDLTTVMRSLLLDRPTFGHDECEILLQEGSLSEEYADITPVKGDRYVTGAYVGFDVRVHERVTRAPYGTVFSTEMTARVTLTGSLE